MSQIFISYAREDIEFASKIVDALAKNKFETWLDWRSLPKGEKVQDEIFQAIEQSDIFLFLISPDSVASPWCQKEINHALKNHKRIIPIVTSNTEAGIIPSEIQERNWIFCREGNDDFDKAISEIFNAISNDYQWVKYHTKLQVKALDWQKDNSRIIRGKELQEAEKKLAFSGVKDPQPTDTQRQYVLASRKDEARRQRQTTIGITIGFIVVSVFCIIAVIASVVAAIQRNIAVSNENARATAQIKAGEQENINLAKRLATEAQLLFDKQDNGPLVATLLAIESTSRYPNAEADEVIRRSLDLLLPLEKIIETAHSENISYYAFSSDGKYLYTKDNNEKVIIMDIENETPVANEQGIIFEEPSTKFGADTDINYTFGPNNRFIATFRVNAKSIILLDTESNQEFNLKHDFFIFSLAFSPNGKYISSGSAEGVIKLWDPTNGKEIGRIIKDEAKNLSFNPSGNSIIAPVNNAIYLWRIPNIGDQNNITSERSYILPFDGNQLKTNIDPTGKWIAFWDQNGNTINVFDISSNELKIQLSLDSRITSLIFNTHGSYLITGTEYGKTCIWDTSLWKQIKCFFRDGIVHKVAISPDNKILATIQSDGTVTNCTLTVWDFQTGERIFDASPGYLIDFIALSNKYIAFSGITNELSLWDVYAKHEMKRFPWIPITTQNESLLFTPNEDWLIANGTNSAQVININNLREISKLTYNSDEFFNLETVLTTVISPDQKKLASVNTVSMMNLTFDAETKREATIRIWDPISGSEIARMVHNSWVNDIVWSPDGNYLLSAGRDGVVRIWDTNNGTEIGAIIHDSPVKQLRFSSNNDQIISISENGVYMVSILKPTDLVLQGCSRVTRNLSKFEWKQYFGDIPYHSTCPNLPISTN